MSQSWNKKHLHNRLDSMFSDMGDSSNLPGLSIFNQLDGWIWEIDTDGLIRKCNQVVEDLLGFKCETLIDQQISQISDLEDQFSDFPRTTEENTVPEKFDITFYHVDGTKVKTATYITPLHSPENSFLGWSGMTIIEDEDTELALLDENNIDKSNLPAPLHEIIQTEGLVSPTPEVEIDDEVETEVPEEASESGEDLYEETRWETTKPKIIDILRTVDDDPAREWEPEEIQLVEQVQNQLELALENASLFQQTQKALAETDEQARKLRLLNEMSERLNQAGHLNAIYQIATQITKDIFDADSAVIATWSDDPGLLEVSTAEGNPPAFRIGEKVSNENKLYFQPVEEYRILISTEDKSGSEPNIHSAIAGPIFASDKKLGVLVVNRQKPPVFDKQDENFMAQLLSILNAEVENRNLFEAIENALSVTEEQARRLTELNKLSELLSQSNTFEAVISNTMERMNSIIPCNVCQTSIWREDQEAFSIFELNNGQVIETGITIKPANTIVGAVTSQKKLITENNFASTQYEDARQLAESKRIQSMIAAPLLAGEKTVGAILIANTEEDAYTSKDKTLLQSISSIMVSTMENRRLFHQIQRRSTQLETSAEVSRIASTILDPSELLPEVVELIKKGFDLYYAGIFLIDESGELTGEPNKWAVLQAGSGQPGRQMLETGHKLEIGGDSMIGSAIANAEALIALNVKKEERFFRNPYLPDTRSEMALPLISRGKVLGALTIQSNVEESFTQEDITSLQTMTDQLANAIENAHLFEQTQARAEELAVLNEMGSAFARAETEEFITENIYKYTSMLMETPLFYVSLYHEEENMLSFPFVMMNGEQVTDYHPESHQWIPRPAGTGLTGYIIENKVPILIDADAENTLKDLGLPFLRFGDQTDSWLGVPMIIGDRILGVISVQSETTPNLYNQHDLDLLTTIASQAAVAINNTRLFNQEQDRAKQERTVRTITDKVRQGTDTQNIMQIALEELSQALNADISVIHLGNKEQLLHAPKENDINQSNKQNGNDSSNQIEREDKDDV